MKLIYNIIYLICVAKVADAAFTTSPDANTNACNEVAEHEIDWVYEHDTDISSIVWRQGASNMMAWTGSGSPVYSGSFTSAFVEQVDKGKIKLKSPTTADSAEYSISVTYTGASGHAAISSTTTLTINVAPGDLTGSCSDSASRTLTCDALTVTGTPAVTQFIKVDGTSHTGLTKDGISTTQEGQCCYSGTAVSCLAAAGGATEFCKTICEDNCKVFKIILVVIGIILVLVKCTLEFVFIFPLGVTRVDGKATVLVIFAPIVVVPELIFVILVAVVDGLCLWAVIVLAICLVVAIIILIIILLWKFGIIGGGKGDGTITQPKDQAEKGTKKGDKAGESKIPLTESSPDKKDHGGKGHDKGHETGNKVHSDPNPVHHVQTNPRDRHGSVTPLPKDNFTVVSAEKQGQH